MLFKKYKLNLASLKAGCIFSESKNMCFVLKLQIKGDAGQGLYLCALIQLYDKK